MSEAESSGRSAYTADQLEDLAFRGVPLPEDLDPGETLLFLMFRNLYEYDRHFHMPREQGRREKARILQLCKRYLQNDVYIRFIAELNKRTELGRRNYRKARTDEERLLAAEQLILAIDGIPVERRPVPDRASAAGANETESG